MNEQIRISAKKREAKRASSFTPTPKTDVSHSINSPINQILHLQRTIGNQAVQRLFKSGVIQAKLKIGQPNDIYEQEADRVAEQVMSMPEPGVQRQVEPEEEEETLQAKIISPDIPMIHRQEEPEEEEEELIQTKPLAEQITPVVRRQPEEEEKKEELQMKASPGQTHDFDVDSESRINAMKGGGRPLPESERAYFEPRFRQDFSNVRVHTNSSAAQMAKAIQAKAFTVGNDVVFGATQYQPGTNMGRRLLAHELTHVVQQNNSSISGKFKVSEPGKAFEREAGETAEAATSGAKINNIATGKPLNKDDRGITPVHTVPIIQMAEPISTITIFGITMGVADAIAAAGLVVGVGLGTTGMVMAYSGMGKTGTGPALTLPKEGGLFLVGQSGKEIITGLIRVLVYKDTKIIGEKAAASKKGSKMAKLVAAKQAMKSQKDNVISNVTTRISNKMQAKLPKKFRSKEFVWNEENSWSKNPTWGSVTIKVKGGCLDPWLDFWVKISDYKEAKVELPVGSMSGAEYFQTIEMSATCDDTTTGWLDDLMVIPEKLDIKDETKGGLCGIGEAGFGWDETTTRMRWDEKKSIKYNITSFPHYRGTPED